MKELEKPLQKLAEAGLKINSEKSFFEKTETKYRRFWVKKMG